MTLHVIERKIREVLVPTWIDAWFVRRNRLGASPRCAAATAEIRRIYIDVSVVARHDAGTGIQRVVRAVASKLLGQSIPHLTVCPVGATRKRPYYEIEWPDAPRASTGGSAIRGGPGEVFLGLDLALDSVRNHRKQLAAFRRRGGVIWFVVYDLLPDEHPEWFSPKVVARYRGWLRLVACLADGVLCISPFVAVQFKKRVELLYGLRDGIDVQVIPMGSDVEASIPTRGRPQGFDGVVSQIRLRPSALIVGTLEPRKAHQVVLEAFEALWGRGIKLHLVIVGRPGWQTEQLQARIRTHEARGDCLFWFDNASDDVLAALYGTCSGVIVASLAEGFGLPLIEALQHGKLVLARDIPVFRMHGDPRITFFPREISAEQLSEQIESWLLTSRELTQPGTREHATWADTSAAILQSIGRNRGI